jgi:diguanylate cyclase (GGDEF)-like protein/PAS domain S-box-containing protein
LERPLGFARELVRLNRSGDLSPELKRRLFPGVFWSLAGMAALGVILTGAILENFPLPRLIQFATFALFAFTWWLHQSGRTSFAFSILVFGSWALSTLVVLSEAGRASHWLVPQFLLIVLARFLLNGRMAIFLGVITAILDFSIYHFHLHLMMPMELRELTLGNDWAAIAVSFVFLLFILFLADAILRETLHTARFSQGRYQSLFDHTNDAVFLIDMNLRYIEANETAADLLGYPRKDLIGKSIFDIVPQEEATAVRNNFHKLDKEGWLPLFERTLVRVDGSRRIAEVSITVVPSEDGKPRYYQSVMRDISERKRLEEDLRYSLEEMESLAMQDPLTGLLNRRAITEHAEAEWHRSKREKRPLCIALVDLDNLKDINDTQGHLVGDKAILALASVIKESLRRYDWAGRWGGDEFMLILPGSNLIEAQEICERLRSAYSSSDFVASLGTSIHPYISVGVACYSARPGDETPLNQLFGQADKALYKAKETGKNKVVIFRDDAAEPAR